MVRRLRSAPNLADLKVIFLYHYIPRRNPACLRKQAPKQGVLRLDIAPLPGETNLPQWSAVQLFRKHALLRARAYAWLPCSFAATQ